MSRPFLTARWEHLVMRNHEVDPGLLQPLVPAGTELDFWNGKTYISIVGFQFLDTRLLGWPIPFHRNFPEVNLRFYVRRRSPQPDLEGEWRRGVTFIREIVPRAAVAFVANQVYHEHYVSVPMRQQIAPPSADTANVGRFSYSWLWERNWCDVAAEVTGSPLPLVAGSEEEFITEHYWGYTNQPNGNALEYQVEHPSWTVWPATTSRFEGNVTSLYGPEFSRVLAEPPTSTFVATGSAISVHRGQPI